MKNAGFAYLCAALCTSLSSVQQWLGLASVAPDNRYVLITSLYNETDPERMREYITCLERNCAHECIGTVHVMYDTSKDDESNILLQYLYRKNIPITFVEDRPTYGRCFACANQIYPNRTIILSNADIYFNHTLSRLEKYDLTNTMLALTRWNVNTDGTLSLFAQYDQSGKFSPGDSYSSQDTWIFKTPLRSFEYDDIKIGTMTCDSLIAYQAYAVGLQLLNPCLSIQCCHLHLSEMRHYDQAKRVTSQPTMVVPWNF